MSGDYSRPPSARCRVLRAALVIACVFCGVSVSSSGGEQATDATWDVVVYGGTSAGVIAAVQAKRMSRTAVIVCPETHLGGLTSGGLGWTDTGNKAVIGGLARGFYHRVWKHYQQPDAWRWQSRDEYGNRGQGTPAIDGAQRTMWIFEPHVAEHVFEDLVAEHEIPVHRGEWLDRAGGIEKTAGRIESITTLSGKTWRGRMFIDATYEGDLVAAAGVSYTTGRESQDTYDEKWNGVQTGVLHHRHHFGVLDAPIDPYVVPGDPTSGILPRISPEPPGEYGAADHRIQAYCFRMCLTKVPENRVPFERPDSYDPGQYELLLRVFGDGWREQFAKFDPIPNAKTDTNNHGPFSTDNIGYNYDYPEGSYERRRQIIREHEQYQRGLMYFMANDPRVPDDIRAAMSEWGLAKDEFADNDNWPHQIYVREARRMVGRYVMTEHEVLKRRPTPEPIGMGSYTMDSHNVQRYVTPGGHVQNEGDVGVGTGGPYSIAFGSILPKQDECENLVVPVCVSASHIAFGSIRMEPVFMILGQSAATTACLALDRDAAVQEVDYDTLRDKLIDDGQVLQWNGPRPTSSGSVDSSKHKGIVVDDAVQWALNPEAHDDSKDEPVTLNVPANGYRGIWYMNQPSGDEYVYKYSGGLGTYCAKHKPLAVYCPQVEKTFFCYGGTTKESNGHLLHMVSYYDHRTGTVPRPTILLDKKTGDAHDNPVISVDGEGYIWIFSTSHGRSRPAYIHKSREPYSVEAFDLIEATREDDDGRQVPITNFSYMQAWHRSSQGFICFFTRYSDPAARTLMCMTSADGVRWSRWQRIAAIGEGHYQISAACPSAAGTAFNYHPIGKGLNWRTNLYYVQTPDFGESWQAASGQPLDLPLTEPENPALVHDYAAESLNVYLKDIRFDAADRPVILYLTSPGYQSGPQNNPRTWHTARWTGAAWEIHAAFQSDNNYDMGSLWIDKDGSWRIIAPSETGPQPYNPGGEVALWISRDQGQNWERARQLTSGSERNHTYVRRPVNAHPDFYALWADGHGRQPSESQLYFCDRDGNVHVLPREMSGQCATPSPLEE